MAGCRRAPQASTTRSDGAAARKSTVTSPCDLAERARDRKVALDVAEADRARQPQHATRRRAAWARGRNRSLRERGYRASVDGAIEDEVADQVVHLDGVPAVQAVAGALERHESRARDGGDHLLGMRVRDDLVEGAVQREDRHREPRKQLVHVGPVDGAQRFHEHVGRRLARPRDAVLDALERMGLGQDAREEPLPVGREVAADGGSDLLVERLRDRLRVLPAEEDEMRQIARVLDRVAERDHGGARKRDERERRPHRLIQHRDQIAVTAVEVVPGRGPVGSAVAAGVGGDDAEVPREVRDLRLELPAIDHGLTLRQQHEVAVAAARGLPEELDAAVGRDTRLSALGRGRVHRGPHLGDAVRREPAAARVRRG